MDTTKEFTIKPVANQKRLDKALSGEARQLVKDMLPHACFVNEIIATLSKKYGGKNSINLAIADNIKNIEPLHSELNNIGKFTLEAKKVLLMLKQGGSAINETTTLTRLVLLMPPTQRCNWVQSSFHGTAEAKGTLEPFVRWL